MIYNKYRYVKRPVKILAKKEEKPGFQKRIMLNILPISLCLVGVGILIYALYPYATYFIEQNVLRSPTEKEILTPGGADSNVQGATTSTDDASDYFHNATLAISSTTSSFLKDHPEYSGIKGEFYLTIDKLKIYNKATTINVDSSISGNYLDVLKVNLAHFKGSSLPGKQGNTFVYGHSARGSIFGTNWESIFSGLKELDVGDQIKIKYDNVQYKYAVTKWKITDPNDTSVVFSTSDKQTLTLMTCYPAGIGNKRLIVTADRVSD